MPDDTKSRDELIREKLNAGLTREQAMDVLDRQAEADTEKAKPVRKAAK